MLAMRPWRALFDVKRTRELQIPLKFITNATRRPRRRVVNDLAILVLEVAIEEVVTPATLAREFLTREKLAPLLIVRPDLREDFLGLEVCGGEAVVVGDAGRSFTYEHFAAYAFTGLALRLGYLG